LRKSMAVVITLLVLFISANAPAQPAAADNAALVYQKAAKLLREMPQDPQLFAQRARDVINNGWSSKSNDLRALVIKNDQAISEFKKGAELEECDFGLGEKPRRTPGEKMPNFSDAVTLARLTLMRARLFEQQKKWDPALDDYLAVLRLGYHCNRQRNHVLLSQMVGVIVQKMVSKPLLDFIKRKDLTFKQASRLSAEMNSIRRGFSGLDKALADEREFARGVGELIMSFDEKGAYKREFLKEFNAREDELFALLNKAYVRNNPGDFNKAIKELDEQLRKDIKYKQRFIPALPFVGASPEEAGKIKDINASMQDPKSALLAMPFYGAKVMARYLAGIGISQYSKVIPAHYIARVDFDLLRTAAALRSYEIKNRELPDSLLAMTPDYLDVVPADPFNYFRPVKYLRSKKEWCVYSFGPDRNDDQAKIVHSGEPEKIEEKGDLIIR